MSNVVNRWGALISFLIICFLTACSAPTPTWRVKTSTLVDDLARQDAMSLYPQEYLNLLETFEHGEAVLLVQGDEQAADIFYLLALQKGSLLKDELLRYKQRKAQEERERIAAEAARVEEERLLRDAAAAEARLREQELRKAVREAQAAASAASALLLLLQSSKHPERFSSNRHSVTRFAEEKPFHRLQHVLKFTMTHPCGR